MVLKGIWLWFSLRTKCTIRQRTGLPLPKCRPTKLKFSSRSKYPRSTVWVWVPDSTTLGTTRQTSSPLSTAMRIPTTQASAMLIWPLMMIPHRARSLTISSSSRGKMMTNLSKPLGWAISIFRHWLTKQYTRSFSLPKRTLRSCSYFRICATSLLPRIYQERVRYLSAWLRTCVCTSMTSSFPMNAHRSSSHRPFCASSTPQVDFLMSYLSMTPTESCQNLSVAMRKSPQNLQACKMIATSMSAL